MALRTPTAEQVCSIGTEVLIHNDGIVDKLIGDEVMGLFIPGIANRAGLHCPGRCRERRCTPSGARGARPDRPEVRGGTSRSRS